VTAISATIAAVRSVAIVSHAWYALVLDRSYLCLDDGFLCDLQLKVILGHCV